MREIKFKAKRIDNGEWVYGYYFKCNTYNTNYIYDFQGLQVRYEVTPETVCQYTGLKDKNGVEIYEGDIYHNGDINIKYLVVWLDTGLIGSQIGNNSFVGLSYWVKNTEITGNKHD